MRAQHLADGALVLLGLATSAACLTYGFCLVWPVAFVLGAAFGALQAGRFEPVRLMVRLWPYAAAVCLPLLLWIGGFAVAGREVAYEAQNVGQFAWPGEAIRSGTLIPEAFWRLWRLAGFVAAFLGPWGWLMLAGALALGLGLRRLRPEVRVVSDPVLAGCLVTVVLMLTFNYLQGYHQARLLLFPLLLSQVAILRLLVLAGESRVVPVVAAVLTVLQVLGGILAPPSSME